MRHLKIPIKSCILHISILLLVFLFPEDSLGSQHSLPLWSLFPSILRLLTYLNLNYLPINSASSESILLFCLFPEILFVFTVLLVNIKYSYHQLFLVWCLYYIFSLFSDFLLEFIHLRFIFTFRHCCFFC